MENVSSEMKTAKGMVANKRSQAERPFRTRSQQAIVGKCHIPPRTTVSILNFFFFFILTLYYLSVVDNRLIAVT